MHILNIELNARYSLFGNCVTASGNSATFYFERAALIFI